MYTSTKVQVCSPLCTKCLEQGADCKQNPTNCRDWQKFPLCLRLVNMNPQLLRASRAPSGVTVKAVPRQTYPTMLSAIPDLDRLNATMSSSNNEPGFRVVETVIEDHLINDAAKEATQASVVKTEAETYSRLECGPACEKLLDYYRKEKHSQVCSQPQEAESPT